MDYIDENIRNDAETIKRGIFDLIGINSHTFGQFFTVLTGDTLGSYIRNRRLYYAAKELQDCPQKSICDIALDYGYSDQSSFTRAFVARYTFSPSELRQKGRYYFLKNNKYQYKDFEISTTDSRSKHVWGQFEKTGFLSDLNLEFVESVEEGRKEFGFDVDTSYVIADLADRIEVPIYALMEACFDLIAEVKSDPRYFSNKEIVAMDLGIRSSEDLENICKYYVCKYYELNSCMVKEYYDSHS
jgi:AraC-like DNA-binding protein